MILIELEPIRNDIAVDLGHKAAICWGRFEEANYYLTVTLLYFIHKVFVYAQKTLEKIRPGVLTGGSYRHWGHLENFGGYFFNIA